MTWIAPDADRVSVPTVADERAMLESWLEFQRQTLLRKCAGLAAERLKRRAAEPSTLSLLGLVRHMAQVERSWFQRRLAGLDIGLIYCADERSDDEFDKVDEADAEADFAVFAREVKRSCEIAAARSLDDTFYSERRGADVSLRWIYVHMIEEYARHNGHADLLRERIDGATGV